MRDGVGTDLLLSGAILCETVIGIGVSATVSERISDGADRYVVAGFGECLEAQGRDARGVGSVPGLVEPGRHH
jgi:hypothetical protein